MKEKFLEGDQVYISDDDNFQPIQIPRRKSIYKKRRKSSVNIRKNSRA